jgi:glutamyl-tRNA synthetase
MVNVRFAPSPTGMLHIGGARTALFNWLFAKHHKGQCFLRIEDTDFQRSTKEAIDKIFESLSWLGLSFDGDVVFQSKRIDRHKEVAHDLLKKGKAYYCYCSPEELEHMRETAKNNKQRVGYNGFWRDRDSSLAPADVKPVIRLKMPQEGETIIKDLVQGTVKVQNHQLDDMVLLRADGTPTYMLSVVVDDHDMNITHIIRGDDHLNNAFRQYHLYEACGWTIPHFAHIPLIYGSDGAKLSKRHGAVGTDAYQELGVLAETMRNYLLRLGWGHGDDEIISTQQAIEWFDLDHVGKSPARFDMDKLIYLNAHYIKNTADTKLLTYVESLLKEHDGILLNALFRDRLLKGMQGLKERAKTLIDLKDACKIYCIHPDLSEMGALKLTENSKILLKAVFKYLQNIDFSDQDALQTTLKKFAEEHQIKLGIIAMDLRIALTGHTVSPNLFEVMRILEKEETLRRIEKFIGTV